jgi:hypothetical protein
MVPYSGDRHPHVIQHLLHQFPIVDPGERTCPKVVSATNHQAVVVLSPLKDLVGIGKGQGVVAVGEVEELDGVVAGNLLFDDFLVLVGFGGVFVHEVVGFLYEEVSFFYLSFECCVLTPVFLCFFFIMFFHVPYFLLMG